MLELKHITVDFGSHRAVDDVSIQLEKGDRLGIIGYSGAGKSTLLRTVNRLQRVTEGEVLFKNVRMDALNEKELLEKRREIGMIFQHFNLLDSKTVKENMLLALKHSTLTKGEKEKKIEELLAFVGLLDKIETYPSNLSGGQKQRVAIARALANDPSLLLCDEATSALDLETKHEVIQVLRRLEGMTMLIVTHEIQVIKELCNKVVVMDHGRIVESGSVLDVFSDPKAPLTRSFLRKEHKLEGIEEKLKGLNLNEEEIYELSYRGKSTAEPMLSLLYENFKVKTNILAGNFEIIQNTPIGTLVVSFIGERVEEALSFLKEHGVRAELLGGRDGLV
ncbi:methionine ABC transporter ATP-binding protein [Guggenheimella bovis]